MISATLGVSSADNNSAPRPRVRLPAKHAINAGYITNGNANNNAAKQIDAITNTQVLLWKQREHKPAYHSCDGERQFAPDSNRQIEPGIRGTEVWKLLAF